MEKSDIVEKQEKIESNKIENEEVSLKKVFESKKWVKVEATQKKVTALTFSGKDIYIIDSDNDIYYYDKEQKKWEDVTGKMYKICVGADGTCLGVTLDQRLFRLDKNKKWIKIVGEHIKHVAVGSKENQWIIGHNSHIYKWGIKCEDWIRVEGKFRQISCNSKGDVLVSDIDSNIYRYDETKKNTFPWTQIQGKMRSVFIGEDRNIIGVDKKDNIYIYNKKSKDWESVKGEAYELSFNNISEEIWVRTREGKVFCLKNEEI